jgi:hypothetical protein
MAIGRSRFPAGKPGHHRAKVKHQATKARVNPKAGQATGASQAPPKSKGGGAVGLAKAAITEAKVATSIKRRFWMKATRGASAPNSSARSIMAIEPPGSMPQIAVLAKTRPPRPKAQAKATLAAKVKPTEANNQGQAWPTVATTSGVQDLAMRQPIRAWAKAKGPGGKRSSAPRQAISRPAIIPPRKRGAGRRARWKRPAPSKEEASKATQGCGAASFTPRPQGRCGCPTASRAPKGWRWGLEGPGELEQATEQAGLAVAHVEDHQALEAA